MKITYRDSGVDVEKGYEAVRLMKQYVEKTFDSNVLTGLGSFGGMYALNDEDVLIAGTDGVGTKLKAAFALSRHDTIGIDCVAMCANDVVCHGAKPLLFLDYVALGELEPENVAEIVKGVSEGCVQAGCALIGGETAEMPGFYEKGEYDLAGFCVGIVKKEKIINGSAIKKGDALLGLASTGVHSNGFSLVRRLYTMSEENLNRYVDSLGMSLGEALLMPTKIYVKTILELTRQFSIKGISHITGGGFIENIPRMLPEGLAAQINIKSYPVPPLFKLLVQDAGLEDAEAYNTFNMGIGMVLAVDPEEADEIMAYINQNTTDTAYRIGSVVEGGGEVILK